MENVLIVLDSKGIQNSDELVQKVKLLSSKGLSTNGNNEVEENPSIKSKKDSLEDIKSTPSFQKKLNDIMKLDLLKDLTSKEISEMWNKYYNGKPVLSATLTPEFYKDMMDYSQKYPFFVLPLPRNEGFEFFFIQFHHDHQVYITSLIEYQTHGPNAKPLFILTYYPELKESKQVILMVGEYGQDSFQNMLTLTEAQNLVYQLQLYYVTLSEKRELVAQFHKNPKEFNYNNLIMQHI